MLARLHGRQRHETSRHGTSGNRALELVRGQRISGVGPDEGEDPAEWRNRVYAACGAIMLACIALIGIYLLLLGDTGLKRLDPVFWLEAAAIFFFGVSWFTKGEAILRDEVQP